MIVAIGVDAIEIARIRGLYERGGERFVRRVYTDAEAAYCRSRHHPAESFAARFAAKEAVMKCLGTGWAEGTAFRQIEVRRLASGDTELALSGVAAERAAARGIRRWHVSLTHTALTATAFVVAEG
ncbi:MAG: holo-ACP synthase [Planctomycetes bacterium]|nr:holo-ACP synthase [Planctomycetota bacterium]